MFFYLTFHGLLFCRNEPNAAAAYTQLTGQELIQCGFAIKSHAPEMAWYGASPDGMIAQPAPDDPLATGALLRGEAKQCKAALMWNAQGYLDG